MAKCTYCGDQGCANCTRQRGANHQPSRTELEIRSLLISEVIEATARNNAASQAFNLAIGQVPSGMDSDGSQRIHDASRELAKARNEVMNAHTRLNNFLSRGIVPEALKVRSG